MFYLNSVILAPPFNFLSIHNKYDSYFIFELACPRAAVNFSSTLLTSDNAFLTAVFAIRSQNKRK